MGDTNVEMLSEENYIKTFLHHLGTFSWDKAKEFVEKKQKLIPVPLQVALSTLAQNEKIYYSMEFLEQRSWFGRKDPLKNGYSTLQSTFLNIEKQEIGTDAQESSILSTICLQLSDFCAARRECINMYMQIPKTSMLTSLDSLTDELQVLVDSYTGKFDCPALNDLQEMLVDEMTAILSLYQASQSISNWLFVDSVHHLQEVYEILEKWKPILGKHQNSSFRSGFFGFGERSSASTSNLYSWMDKFFKALVSKFTFYFYENLSQSAAKHDDLKSELKTGLSKISYDFVSKSLHYAKKNDVQNIFLLLDTRKSQTVLEHGYSFPEPNINPVITSPAEDFTCVLTLPETSATSFSFAKAGIYEKAEELEQEKIVTLQNGDKKGTCFCAQIDRRMFLVILFNQAKSEKDHTFATFFNDILNHLRLKKVALLIKPGSK